MTTQIDNITLQKLQEAKSAVLFALQTIAAKKTRTEAEKDLMKDIIPIYEQLGRELDFYMNW